ncbi:MAG: arsenate reductase/protein-tyrosine-phosphatase family protein [Acidimicrobiales bacterium]
MPMKLPSVLMLCTGNAARSVMAEVVLQSMRDDILISSAGTLAIEGQPLSIRTRSALEHMAMPVPFHHRSRELSLEDTSGADLIVAMAREHVRYVRRYYPEAASRTATLRWLAEELPAGSEPLSERLGRLCIESVDLEEMEDVADPAEVTAPSSADRIAAEIRVYVECALEIRDLVAKLECRI